MEARIFASTGTLDAISSKRSYNENRGFDYALFEIEKGRGSLFNPILSEIFLAITREKWQQIKVESGESLSLAVVH